MKPIQNNITFIFGMSGCAKTTTAIKLLLLSDENKPKDSDILAFRKSKQCIRINILTAI